jgi:hypothetical protein
MVINNINKILALLPSLTTTFADIQVLHILRMIFDVEDLLFIFIYIAVSIRARNKRISNSSQSRVIP